MKIIRSVHSLSKSQLLALPMAGTLVLMGCGEFGSLPENALKTLRGECLPQNQTEFEKSLQAQNKILIGDMIFEIETDSPTQELSATKALRVQARDHFEKWSSTPWTGGKMPVAFVDGITQDQKDQFFEACLQWEKGTGFRCVKHMGQKEYLEVRTVPSGCYSEVGVTSSPPTEMFLSDGCFNNKGTITHEIGHALGLAHEHQRQDRDKYIQVHWQNIDNPGNAKAFEIIPTGYSHRSEYDFHSIMHYRDYFYAKAGTRTMTPQPAYNHIRKIGRSSAPTTIDLELVASIYPTYLNPTPSPKNCTNGSHSDSYWLDVRTEKIPQCVNGQDRIATFYVQDQYRCENGTESHTGKRRYLNEFRQTVTKLPPPQTCSKYPPPQPKEPQACPGGEDGSQYWIAMPGRSIVKTCENGAEKSMELIEEKEVRCNDGQEFFTGAVQYVETAKGQVFRDLPKSQQCEAPEVEEPLPEANPSCSDRGPH